MDLVSKNPPRSQLLSGQNAGWNSGWSIPNIQCFLATPQNRKAGSFRISLNLPHIEVIVGRGRSRCYVALLIGVGFLCIPENGDQYVHHARRHVDFASLGSARQLVELVLGFIHPCDDCLQLDLLVASRGRPANDCNVSQRTFERGAGDLAVQREGPDELWMGVTSSLSYASGKAESVPMLLCVSFRRALIAEFLDPASVCLLYLLS